MHKKMIIIGMDGLDARICQKMMDQGELPHFKSIAAKGAFLPLQTSNPPQSPVAWSCFISGHNPGQHSVFDFITRDPKTYLPEIGMTEVSKTSKGGFLSRTSGPQVKSRRKGKAFWDVLSENGVPSVVLHCPVTFPAEPLNGRLISGMGTPDIKGTQGIFTYYTTLSVEKKDIQGRITTVKWDGDQIQSVLTGPKKREAGQVKEVDVPVQLTRINRDKIKIEIQGTSQELAVGQWSDWFQIQFKLGFLNNISGISRFHLEAVEPDLKLYCTPVNLDPAKPAMKISYPDDYAAELYKHMGFYFTQGMPYDTWALNEERLNEKSFLEMAYQIQDENLAQFHYELGRFKGGLLFCYFGITDLIQHMFWRYTDPHHPNTATSPDPQIQNAIPQVYKHMDGVLGKILEKLDPDTHLLVLSDHGFGSFRRAVHINSWLRDNGYLVLTNGDNEGKELFKNVDWSQTRAYSLGFGGIYFNRFGREEYGIVYPGAETDILKREMEPKLLDWRDEDGTKMIHALYEGKELYFGPHADQGPDFFIGFNDGYRASWQTALGAAPQVQIEDNLKKWGGDHLCDPSLVPGVLFSNQKLKVQQARLVDLAPTILSFFELKSESPYDGNSLL